jgi:hypothetical protein
MTEVVAGSGLVIVGPASDAGVHAHEVSSWTTFRAGSPRDPDPSRERLDRIAIRPRRFRVPLSG